MPNPLTEESRDVRWEAGLDELSLKQLRAPSSLDWLRHEAKPSHMTLPTFLLKSAFDAALIAMIVAGNYRGVIGQLVRTWPELLTTVSAADDCQRRPLAKAGAR